MNDEEILSAASRQGENAEGEYEISVERKDLLYAMAAGILLCTVMIVTELVIFRRLEYGKPAILLTVYSTVDLRSGIKWKKKKLLIYGIVKGILAIIFVLLYIGALIR